MQATQSGTASAMVEYSGKFAALRHVTRQMNFKAAPLPAICRPVAAPTSGSNPVIGVAEGAGLAHDAGNLLGALSLYSDLLAMPGVLHDEHWEYASELRMLSDRSWAMIDRLANHARSGQRVKPAAEPVMLPKVVDRCKGLLSRVAGRTVEISYGVGAYEQVNVPAESVERIVTNLVKNAAEATPWMGSISVRVEGAVECPEQEGEAPRRRVTMTVRDRGCGMDAAEVRRLMQGEGRAQGNGRGIGFRVVRELVALSGGSLTIDSHPGMGTGISIEWYAAKQTEAAGQRFDSTPGTVKPAMKIVVKPAMKIVVKPAMKIVVKEDAGWIAC